MAELAVHLLRTVARAFYGTEHILVIDALIFHSTLSDKDLSEVLGIQNKSLRKICGRLREDGLLSLQQRAERKTDGTQAYFGASHGQPGKERLTYRDWYYLNYHRAIDSIKYRLYKLSKHVESLGAPTSERKDLSCPRCKSQYTELEVLDKKDFVTGVSYCRRCNNALDEVEEDERASENESMKRLNSQLEKILGLMQQIDATTVPENDFQTALGNYKPIEKSSHQGPVRTEAFDLPNGNVQSTKGLDIKPEKIAVQIQDDEAVSGESQAAEARARREAEAKQNALPEWIAQSTITGDKTTVGAREERSRRERDITAGLVKEEVGEEKKPVKDTNDDVMAAYFAELERAKAEDDARAKAADEEEDEDDDDDDEFEDVEGNDAPNRTTTLQDGLASGSNGISTPGLESSNATDDERDAKRVKIEVPLVASVSNANGDHIVPAGNGSSLKIAEDTPAASDEDEDDMEFEDV